MKADNTVAQWSDHKSRSCLCTIFATVSLICGVLFAGGAWFRANTNLTSDIFKLSPEIGMKTIQQPTDSSKCKEKCRPIGSEPLPEGIVARISDLEMHPLWGNISNDVQLKASVGLLAISVGISQKILVDKIVTKFLGHNFAVMLFHYDGIVDQWHDLQWSSQVIHVSAMNQTKWWFAKRFLHPDIVADYDYIFLWDEDLGVENFDPGRYLSIVKEEGLEISQPALDPLKSEVHNPITVRMSRSKVHRRYYKYKGGAKCYANSTAPPCVGWVEMMAPVFSRASWRCVWYMIQNDLVHAWGLDTLLGYCSQGDRTTKVGVVDEQYIVHLGLPTLGGTSGSDKNKLVQPSSSSTNPSSESPSPVAEAVEYGSGNRSAVRRRSYDEMIVFRRRWKQAVDQDRCWRDPFAKEH